MGFKMLSPRENNNLFYNFDNAYYKVANVRMDGDKINFDLITYPDKVSRDSESQDYPRMPHEISSKRIYSKPFSIDAAVLTIPTAVEGETIDDLVKKAIYLYLKTLSEYTNAIDVL